MDWKKISLISSVIFILLMLQFPGFRNFQIISVYLSPLLGLLTIWISLYLSNLVVSRKFSQSLIKGIFAGLIVSLISFVIIYYILGTLFVSGLNLLLDVSGWDEIGHLSVGIFNLIVIMISSIFLSVSIVKKNKNE